jgi:hypothetical protein
MMSPFSNREIVIVTMHQKEKIIGPILREQTGMIPLVSQGVNTDAFGMFSGERSRTGTPGEAALGKIDAAVKTHPQYSLFLASEGSFFPSPHIPFFTLNEELLLLKDLKNNWSVMATYQWNHTSCDKQIRPSGRGEKRCPYDGRINTTIPGSFRQLFRIQMQCFV